MQSIDDLKILILKVELFFTYEELKTNKYILLKVDQRQANILHDKKLC